MPLLAQAGTAARRTVPAVMRRATMVQASFSARGAAAAQPAVPAPRRRRHTQAGMVMCRRHTQGSSNAGESKRHQAGKGNHGDYHRGQRAHLG